MGGIPYLALIGAAVLILSWVVLALMPVGRHIFAVGVNEEAAFLSGITVLGAVLLGGVAFDGGRGSMWGVLLGVLILQNGLTLLNAPATTTSLLLGVALLVAAGLDCATAAVANVRKRV